MYCCILILTNKIKTALYFFHVKIVLSFYLLAYNSRNASGVLSDLKKSAFLVSYFHTNFYLRGWDNYNNHFAFRTPCVSAHMAFTSLLCGHARLHAQSDPMQNSPTRSIEALLLWCKEMSSCQDSTGLIFWHTDCWVSISEHGGHKHERS